MCLLKEIKTATELGNAITKCPKCKSPVQIPGILSDRPDYFRTRQLTIECHICDMANTYLLDNDDLQMWIKQINIPLAPNGRFTQMHNPLHPNHWKQLASAS